MEITFGQIWAEAEAAYRKGYEAAQPVPMIVGSPSTPFGKDIDPRKDMWFVNDGVCGFAWIWFLNGRGKFASFLKEKGASKPYDTKGLHLWSSRLMKGDGQSMARKEAGCKAAVEVFRKYGIECYVQSRMD